MDLIDSEMESAYWTGRFMAASDRIQSHTILGRQSIPRNAAASTFDEMECLVPADLELGRSCTDGSGLTGGNTKGSMATFTVGSDKTIWLDGKQYVVLTDEERIKRAFRYLEKCCVTPEALNSFYTWQEQFARSQGQECLLPVGGSMKDSKLRKLFKPGPKQFV